MTHYIPEGAPSGSNTGVRRATCGAYVPETAHQPDPSCPHCLLRLQIDAVTDRALAAKWSAER